MIGRIGERRAFDRLRRDGRRASTEHLWCAFIDDPAVVPARLGFAIGRGVGPAVDRNRLRRRLRAIVDAHARAGELRPGWLLVGARPGASELAYDHLADEIGRALVLLGARPATVER